MTAIAVDADGRSTDPPVVDRATQNVVFATVVLGLLLAALDQTIVSTALPTIVGDLGSSGHQSWVVTSYLLAETVITAVVGKLGDLFGRKVVFQVSIVVFVIGSALSGAAQSMEWLIAARAIQGLGGGGLTVTATALIGDVIPLRERGRYQGMLGAVFGVTTVLGPLLGGIFTDDLTWRWAFYVNVPVAIVVIAMSARTIPQIRSGSKPRIDRLGILFVGLGAAGLTLATSWGGTTYPWLSGQILGLAGASVVSLGAFVWVESRAAEPVLPLRLFRNSVFSTCCALSFIVGFAMLGAITFLPTFQQYVDGVSATISGLRLLPLVFGLLITSVTAGTLVGRTGRYKIFPLVGTVVIGIGLFLLSRLNEHTSTVVSSLFMLVLGAGIGCCMQVLTLIVQNTSSYADLGVATSGVTFFRTLGGSFGASVFGSLYSNFLRDRLPHALGAARVPPSAIETPEALHRFPASRIAPVVHAYAQSLDHVFIWAVPVAAIGFAVALALREVPLRGTAKASASDIGDGFAMPTQESSQDRLERAIARILRTRGREVLPAVIAQSGTPLTPAGSWGVVEIIRYQQAFGHADISDMARRHHLPAVVLEPTFSQLTEQRMITRNGNALEFTDAGEHEVARVLAAFRGWLGEQLSDWEYGPDSAEIGAALSDISRKLLQHHDEHRVPPSLAPAT
ncbi:MAG TPA: MDR family MFS transporter [Solirubrobacteraceae bacterium]|jgi:EmrB/QacA subfamily drug resistance transporter